MKKVQERQKAQEAKMVADKVFEETKLERKRRIADMLEESEGVAKNIAKVEKKLKLAAKKKKWMDVVMGA